MNTNSSTISSIVKLLRTPVDPVHTKPSDDIFKDVGADAFLGKPFNSQELISTVRNLIQLKSSEEKLRAAHEELKVTSEEKIRHSKNLLVQSEKLASIGQLVASIGHEIANPIWLASINCDVLEKMYKDLNKSIEILIDYDDPAIKKCGAQLHKKIQKAKQVNENNRVAANQLNEISGVLRTQSRKDDKPMQGVDLNELVKDCLLLVKGRIHQIEVTENLIDLQPITCFRSRIGQVITNLLANAADALHEKKARVNVDGTKLFRPQIEITTGLYRYNGLDGFLMSISDNGDGVPENKREKIFEEFFTTKPAGKGTGLGLSMCMDIVKDHDGWLTAAVDEKMGGARFELWLPIEKEWKLA